MGRQPDGNYIIPDGTYGAPDQTVYSARYNGWVNDVANTFNLVQPVNKGGTGADNAEAALVNLSGEKATQLVTNYNSHLFYPGSFRSANTAGIPGAPVDSHAFAGACYLNEPLVYPPTNQNLIIEARDESDTTIPGRTYVREKKAGTWGPWTGGIFAAPFDALAYNGMQINGSMEVSQERGITSIAPGPTAAAYVIDGWIGSSNLLGTGRVAFSQVPLPTEVAGIKNTLQFSVTASQATLGANDYVRFKTNIEGYRFSRVAWGSAAAIPVTVGFWVRAEKAGTYRALLHNFDASIITPWMPFTITAAVVFQWVTITFSPQTTGTWKTNNEIGACMIVEMASNATPNNIQTTAGFASLTGVVVLPGTQAPTAAQSPLIMRPYDQELITCQRYFQTTNVVSGAIAIGQAISATRAMINVPFPGGKMRAIPTLTSVGGFDLWASNAASLNLTTFPVINSASVDKCVIDCNVASGLVAGNATLLVGRGVSASLFFDARL